MQRPGRLLQAFLVCIILASCQGQRVPDEISKIVATAKQERVLASQLPKKITASEPVENTCVCPDDKVKEHEEKINEAEDEIEVARQQYDEEKSYKEITFKSDKTRIHFLESRNEDLERQLTDLQYKYRKEFDFNEEINQKVYDYRVQIGVLRGQMDGTIK